MRFFSLVLFLVLCFNAHGSSVECYKKAIDLKDMSQDAKAKQAFAYNLCKGSEDTYPVSCYEEFINLPDYIIPTLSAKHYTALSICRGAIRTKVSPMNCFNEAIKLPLDLTLTHKTPVDFAIHFCKAKHQYL